MRKGSIHRTKKIPELNSLKILKVSESHGWSGGAAQLLALSRGLRSQGCSIKVACPPGGELWKRLEAEGFDLFPFTPFQDYDLLEAWQFSRWLQREKPDLVHAHHSRAHVIALAAGYLGRRPPPLVVTRRVSFRIPRNPFSRFKYLNRRVSGYIAVAQSIKERLLEAGVPPHKIEMIPSGTDFSEFKPRPRDAGIVSELHLGDLPVIGKIGHHGSWKGQNLVLEAAAEVLKRRSAIFVFIGRGIDGPELRERARQLDIEDHVRLVGFRRDIPRFLSCMTICVNAALEGEGISGALREALAMGIPVVASDVGGNRELVKGGRTGELFPAGDAQALASRILSLLETPARARRLAELGRRSVLQDFSIKRMVDRTTAFYERVLYGTLSTA